MHAGFGRWLRRAVNHARGDQNIESLVAAGLKFGQGAFVIHRAYLDPERPWLIKLGARSAISSNVKVFTHDDSMKIHTGLTRIAPVELGERVFVGAGSTIRPGTRIGENSIIAAGAVVGGEVPPGSVVAGHPARVITTVGRFQSWQRRALADAPVWPREGWIPGLGITPRRKASQREALATAREGYSRPPASSRRLYMRSKLAGWLAAPAAVGWRGIDRYRMKRLIADALRGERGVERHVLDGLQLGEGAFIADEAFVDGRRPWLITIGADSYIAPHVIILSHDGSQMQDGLTRIGRVDIGARVYVGPGAMILPGSEIGDDSVIEAGAVVRGAVPGGSYVIGNPAVAMADAALPVEDSGDAAPGGPSWPYVCPSSDASAIGGEQARRASSNAHVSRPRLTRRAIAHMRGEQMLEQLVADGLQLGERASVAPRAYLDPGRPWLIAIGEDSVVSDFAIIMAHDPGPENRVAKRVGRVVLGKRVFVAPGAIILPGTTIGDDSVIDLRAVVCGDIPPGSFVSGNPGRIEGKVEDMAQECRQAAAQEPDALATASDGFVRASLARG